MESVHDVVDLCGESDNHSQDDDIVNDSDDDYEDEDTSDDTILDDDEDYLCQQKVCGSNYNLRLQRARATTRVRSDSYSKYSCSQDVECLGTRLSPSTFEAKSTTRQRPPKSHTRFQRIRRDLYMRQPTSISTTTVTKATTTRTTTVPNSEIISDTSTTTFRMSSSSISRNDLCGGSGVGMSGYTWIPQNDFKSIPSIVRKQPTNLVTRLLLPTPNTKGKRVQQTKSIPKKQTTKVTKSSRYRSTYSPKQQQTITNHLKNVTNNTFYNSVRRSDTELQHVGGASIAF
jgi:hypothetical protein